MVLDGRRARRCCAPLGALLAILLLSASLWVCLGSLYRRLAPSFQSVRCWNFVATVRVVEDGAAACLVILARVFCVVSSTIARGTLPIYYQKTATPALLER